MSASTAYLRKMGMLLRGGLRRRMMVVEAALTLAVVRITLALRPFARIAESRGRWMPPQDPRIIAGARAASPGEARAARRVGWAVRTVAPCMPFRALCLQQALAAHAMLERRGIAGVLHFGTARVGQQLGDGHAWLDAAGVRVTGYPVDPDLTELGCLL